MQLQLALAATEVEYESRREAFRAAKVKAVPDELAGRYLALEHSILIAPSGEFLFSWEGITGDHHNLGRVVSVSSDRVVLAPVLCEPEFDVVPDTTLFRVNWRNQQLLIEEWRMADFLNNYNEREAGMPFWYLLRRGDVLTDEPRIPSVPAEFRDYLHPEPLHATVTTVGDATISERGKDGGACYELALAVDVGRSHGVFVGMKLYPVQIDGFLGLEIEDVGSSTSHGRYSDCFERGAPVVLPNVGWAFSTLSPMSRHFDGFAFADHPMMESERDRYADPNANADSATSAPAEKR